MLGGGRLSGGCFDPCLCGVLLPASPSQDPQRGWGPVLGDTASARTARWSCKHPLHPPSTGQLGTAFGWPAHGDATPRLAQPPLTVTSLGQSQPFPSAGCLPVPLVPQVPPPPCQPSLLLQALGLCHPSPPCWGFFCGPFHRSQAFCPRGQALSHDPFYLQADRWDPALCPCTVPHPAPSSPGAVPHRITEW